jgi:hypothetical protein
MAVSSTKIHPISAGGTNPIYIDLGRDAASGVTELQPISLDHSNKNKLKITFNNIHIRLTTGHFNYWIGVWPRYRLTYKNASNQNKTKTVSYTVKGTKQVVTLGDGTTYNTWHRQNSQKALIIKDATTWYASTVSRVNATSKVSFASNTYTEEISLTNEEGKGLFKLEIDFDVYSFHTPGGTGSIDQWGCTCADHKEVDFQTVSSGLVYWTSVSAGSASIADNGNNSFTITANTGSGGINNNLHLNRIFYKIVPSGTSADSISYTYDDDYDFTSSTKTMTKTISGTCTVYTFVRTYGTKYGTPASPGGDARNKADSSTDSQVVKFYIAPKWKSTANLTFTSGDSGQYNNRPRLKKPLKWTWTGAVAGNTEDHNVIRGYQIYICNGGGGTDKAVGLYPYRGDFTLNSGNTSPGAKVFETSTNNSAGAYDYVINRGTTNHTLVTDGSGNISFTPIDLDFASKNICYCRVRPFSYWGNRVATKELDSDGNKADYDQYAKNYGPWLIGICTADGSDDTATYIKGTQCILSNGAVVWVRVPKPDDADTLEWKEGTVYVYHGGGWKEAEGVYVRNGSKWKEST